MRRLFGFVRVLLPITVYLIHGISADCVMFGVCHSTKSSSWYCPVNNTSPRPLNDPAVVAKLQKKCPHLFEDGNSLCCSEDQVHSLLRQMQQADAIFGRCPSCNDNFWKNWCQFTCSPHQSDFVKVTETELSPENVSYVVKTTYDVSHDFLSGLYNSCKDVLMGTTPAINVMCGSSPGPCTGEKWMSFLGTRNPTLNIPLDIEFRFHEADSAQSYMHMNTTRCDQSARFGLSKCSRQDCPIVQTKQFFPEDTGTQETCRFMGIGCTVYYLLFAIAVFLFITICVLVTSCMKDEDTPHTDYRSVNTERGTFDSVAYWIEKQIKVNCSMFGEFMATHRCLCILFGLFLIVLSCCGFVFLTVSNEPADLWTAPNGRAMQEKRFFDTNFGPFYRIQQITMFPKSQKFASDRPVPMGAIFDKEFMKEVFAVVNRVRTLSAKMPDGRKVSLADVCHRPLGPSYDCLIQSPTNYFQHNASLLEHTHIETEAEKGKAEEDEFDYYSDDNKVPSLSKTYLDHIYDCINNPYNVDTSVRLSCLGTYGGPTFPNLVFGGSNSETYYFNSTAVTITILLSGRVNVKKAKIWEESFISMLKEYKHDNVQMSFMAERSLVDEIQRESEADGFTVLIASVLMILYVIFSLGQYTVEQNRLLTMFLHSKCFIGIVGIFCIAAAVASSIGVMSLYGLIVPSTAIVVMCFVILGIGSNRMFLTIQSIQRQHPIPGETMQSRMFRICGSILPTLLLCTASQALIFYAGALNPVPAVRSFSLMSGLAVAFLFIYHCTIFLPFCVYDLEREEKGLLECFCCQPADVEPPEGEGIVRTVLASLAPFLMKPAARGLVIGFTILMLLISPLFYPFINLGLDQKMAVPEDSYMYIHFKNMDKFMNVGPPVYFVIQGDIDLRDKYWQDKFCSMGGCAEDSIGAILSQATTHGKITYLKGEVLNWMDNYLDWMQPGSECCRVVANQSHLEYCPSGGFSSKSCVACDAGGSFNRPSRSSFYRHLRAFMEDVPNSKCIKGGRAAFKDAIHLDPRGHVEASHFMTYHVPLRSSEDFLAAMEGARMVSRKIEHSLDNAVKVFPYSMYYVYYDQFLTIRLESAYQLIIAMTTLFVCVCVVTGIDAWSAVIVSATCLLHLVSIVVLMSIWSIEFNPITAVNLVMAVASSTEFVIPLLMSFQTSLKKSRTERAVDALVNAGSTIFSGITMTMLIGTMMLASAHSQFFKVFFFRMLLGIGVSGAYLGLVFLPSLLSVWGPPIKHWRLAEYMAEEGDRVSEAEQLKNPSSSDSNIKSNIEDLMTAKCHSHTGLLEPT